MLNYRNETNNTQLALGLFYKDKADHFDELDPISDNTGTNLRRHEDERDMNLENLVKQCSYKEEYIMTFLTRVNCY